MATRMSEKQYRQQFSPEQRKALERLLQRQAEENNKAAAESEASTDTPKSTLSGASGPPSIPPRTPPAPPANPPSGGSGGSGGDDNRVIAVRVVENHPSVAPQTVKVVADSTAAGVVSSIHHLEEETKFGFMRLVMAFSQLYDSIKNIGTVGRGPSATTPQGSGGKPQHQRTYDPARPDSGPIKPYTRQADKFETYGNKVFHERVQEAFTPEALGDRLKNAMFDRDGIIGGYAHRMFDRRKIGKEYAGRKLRESTAHMESIEEDAKKLADSGKSKAEVDAYRADRLKTATDQGLITDLSEKELRQRGMEINDLRKQAAKKVGLLEHRRNRGERTESINRSKEAQELESINETIGGLDPREQYLLDKYRKRKTGGPTSPTPDPSPAPVEPVAPVEPEIGSAGNPYEWPSSGKPATPEIGSAGNPYEWPPRIDAAPTGTPLEAPRSSDTTQSTKESQEETTQFNEEWLGEFRKIEENTRPIPDIKKFLDEKFTSKDSEDSGTASAEPSRIIPNVTDLIPSIPGGTSSKIMGALKFAGRNAKGLSAVGAGLFGAYDAYTGMQDANQALAAGQITEEEATVAKGKAVGSGVGMAFGAGFGGAVGSVLGPLGTIGGAWLGGKIGGAIGDVGGEIATEGAQSLYHGYQWLTGQEDEPEAQPVKKRKGHPDSVNGKPWSELTPEEKKHSRGISRSINRRFHESRADARRQEKIMDDANVPWEDQGNGRRTRHAQILEGGRWVVGGVREKTKPTDFMGPGEPEQLKAVAGDFFSPAKDRKETWGPVERHDAGSIAPNKMPPQQSVSNTGIVVNAPSTSTTQVMPPPTKPAFNTDPTFLKYGSSRWGVA